jgi:hypothetical protein
MMHSLSHDVACARGAGADSSRAGVVRTIRPVCPEVPFERSGQRDSGGRARPGVLLVSSESAGWERYPSLDRASLDRATCFSTVFTDVDLSEVKGLKSVRHYGPSLVSTDTLFRSKGKIPKAFLQGCGVPDIGA